MMIGSIKSAPDVDDLGFALSSDRLGELAPDGLACRVITESDIASSISLASASSSRDDSVNTNCGTSEAEDPWRV